MALIKIPSGEVIRHVGTNGGFQVEEYVTLPDGRSFPKKYTVWHKGEPPVIGAIVEVFGIMSAKINEFLPDGGGPNIRRSIDISVNEPTWTILGQPKPETPEATAEAIQDIVDDIAKQTELPF